MSVSQIQNGTGSPYHCYRWRLHSARPNILSAAAFSGCIIFRQRYQMQYDIPSLDRVDIGKYLVNDEEREAVSETLRAREKSGAIEI